MVSMTSFGNYGNVSLARDCGKISILNILISSAQKITPLVLNLLPLFQEVSVYSL